MSIDVPEQLQYHMIKESAYTEYIRDVSVPQEEAFMQEFVSENMKKDKVEKFRTLDIYDKYLKWCDKTKQSFKMEKRKFLVQLKKATDDTAHITVYKSGGTMCARFDWNSLHNEGKYIKMEEEEYDEIGEVCSADEEEMA